MPADLRTVLALLILLAPWLVIYGEPHPLMRELIGWLRDKARRTP